MSEKINQNEEKPNTKGKKGKRKHTETEQKEETLTPSCESNAKKIRYDYSFWVEKKENLSDVTVGNTNVVCKIRDLNIGKYDNKPLKLRVTYVSTVRVTKLGDCISFHGLDESGEICLVNFGESCQGISKYLKINSLYSVMNFSVNQENTHYPSGSGNDLQIRLNSHTEIEELDDIENFPQIFFKFVSLQTVQRMNKNEKIDVIGILVKDFGLEKNHKGVPMRELALTDDSKTMLTITLWGNNAELFSLDNFTPLVIRKAVITEYEGLKKLNIINGSLVWANSDVPESIQLKEKFDKLIDPKNL